MNKTEALDRIVSENELLPCPLPVSELVDSTMDRIIQECETERWFLGTVNAREVIRKHIARSLTALEADNARLRARLAEALKAPEPGEPEINAAQEQISEGIGAYLRKFTDSLDAARARDHLHKMPKSEWAGLTRTLAEEAVTAAFRAARRVREGGR